MPEGVAQGYALAARAQGAEIRLNCELLDVETSGGEITEVLSDHGSIRTGTVIAALYEMTPDDNAIIGEARGPSRFTV